MSEERLPVTVTHTDWSSGGNVKATANVQTGEDDDRDWTEDDQVTTAPAPPPALRVPRRQKTPTSTTLQTLTNVLVGCVVLYMLVYLLIKLMFPSPRKMDEIRRQVRSIGYSKPGLRVNKNGSIGGGSGVNVHAMEWHPRYGWLIDINKQYCDPERVHSDGSGLCADPEDANKWCSKTCKVMAGPNMLRARKGP